MAIAAAPRRATYRPGLEGLEPRAVPAAVSLSAGVLAIQGDARSEVAVVGLQGTTVVVDLRSGTGAAATRLLRSYPRSAIDRVTFDGRDGSDRLVLGVNLPVLARGGRGNDSLQGAGASDTLYGDSGNDTLVGGGGADALFGGADQDSLAGSNGNDGLYGGDGTDSLWGGAGGDRFLERDGASETRDRQSADAVIRFRSGSRAWTQTAIEQIDRGLALLHARTGNTRLLKRADGQGLVLERQTVSSLDPDFLALNQNDGRISLYDAAFATADQVRLVIIHEVAHNWDREQDDWSSWLAVSDWRPAGSELGPGYARSGDGLWFYQNTTSFARAYGRTSPEEDWGTAWESEFTTRYSLPNIFGVSPLAPSKRNFLQAFFSGLT
jgi:hypothetical protein